jgi:hypothetical protein
MDIEMNPTRIPKPELGQPVPRRGASSAASDAVSIPTVSSLAARLNDIPLVRPEKLETAKALISDEQYPPSFVLDRIIAILASHLKHSFDAPCAPGTNHESANRPIEN